MTRPLIYTFHPLFHSPSSFRLPSTPFARIRKPANHAHPSRTMSSQTKTQTTTGPPKLPIAVLGIGRMGQRHALNLLHRTPRADLVAIADPNPAALQWAEGNLPGVQRFESFETLLDATGVKAVLIASMTGKHAEMAIKAIEKGVVSCGLVMLSRSQLKCSTSLSKNRSPSTSIRPERW